MKIPNFRNDHFPFPTLTPVEDIPDYGAIRKAYQECIANASSVTTTLGGGEQGHKGLVMTEGSYVKAFGAKYNRPRAPAKLDISHLTNPVLILKKKEEHQLQLDECQFVDALERTIFAQLQAAFKHKVLQPKIDRNTGLIKVKIPQLFQYLFKTYGNITAQGLVREKQSLLDHTYVHSDPLDLIFELVESYCDKAATFGCPETEEQKMHMTTIILMNANIFADGLQDWNKKDDMLKTWDEFQEFFINYQELYKEARSSITTASAGFTPDHQANAVAPPEPDQSLALQEAQAWQAYLEEVSKQATATTAPSQANAATSISTEDMMTKILQQMETLTLKIAEVDKKGNDPKENSGKGKGKSKDKFKKYCWTHGACAHTSKECNHKATGHKDDATFHNLLGGSTKNCYMLPASTSA